MKPRKICGLAGILAVLLVAACDQKTPEPKTALPASNSETAATSSGDTGTPSQNRPVESSK